MLITTSINRLDTRTEDISSRIPRHTATMSPSTCNHPVSCNNIIALVSLCCNSSKDQLFTYLRWNNLLPNPWPLCGICEKQLRPIHDEKRVFGFRLRCGGRHDASPLNGTWFSPSKLPVNTQLLLLYFWFRKLSPTFTSTELDVEKATVTAYFQRIRKACDDILHSNPERYLLIGGQNAEVQVELFKFKSSNQGQKSTRSGKTGWVLGGVESSSPQRLFLVVVSDREQRTLHSAITKRVRPGSIIVSDDWAGFYGFEKISGFGYQHKLAPHGCKIVSTEGFHTQRIKGIWRWMKSRLPLGRNFHVRSTYLNEFVYRQHLSGKSFEDFLRDLATLFQPASATAVEPAVTPSSSRDLTSATKT